MSESRARDRPRAALVAFCLGAGLLGAPTRSSADTTPSLALEPAPAGDHGFAVERAGVREHLLPSARLLMDYAREPLVLINPAQEADYVVSYQAWLHVLATFSIKHFAALSVDAPFVLAQGSGPELGFTPAAARPDSSADVGDLRFGARVLLYGSPEDAAVRTDIALAGSIWVPTATDGHAGDGVSRFRASLNVEGSSPRFYWAANAGLRARPTESLPGASETFVGTSITIGLGAGVFIDAARHLAFGAEFVADLTVAGSATLFDHSTIAHLLGTGHYRIAGGPFEVGAAFGPGIGQGVGSATYRALLFVGFAPESPTPPTDTDGDTTRDQLDACPTKPGPPSKDPLRNGCPAAPTDRDGDLIFDDDDACPAVFGVSSFEPKTHGCPKVIDTDRRGPPEE